MEKFQVYGNVNQGFVGGMMDLGMVEASTVEEAVDVYLMDSGRKGHRTGKSSASCGDMDIFVKKKGLFH